MKANTCKLHIILVNDYNWIIFNRSYSSREASTIFQEEFPFKTLQKQLFKTEVFGEMSVQCKIGRM